MTEHPARLTTATADESTETKPAASSLKNDSSSGPSLRFRSRSMAGLVLVIPIWLTYVVVTFVFRLMRDASMWLVEGLLLTRLGVPLLSQWGLEANKLAEGGLTALPLPVRSGIGAFSVMLTIGTLYVLGAVSADYPMPYPEAQVYVTFDSSDVTESIESGMGLPTRR